MSTKSDAAETLLFQLRAAAVPAPTLEHVFHANRKWRFDLCWPVDKIAVEVDGGNHLVRNGRAVGRHTQSGDYEKLNEATLYGWRVLRFTPEMVKSGMALAMIERVLGLVKEVNDSIPF